MTRVNCDGTRRVLDAAGRARRAQGRAAARAPRCTARGRTTRCRSPRMPCCARIPATCPRSSTPSASARSLSGLTAKDGRVATRLRIAPVVGAGSNSVFAAAATGRPPVVLRGPRRAGAGRARRRRRACVARPRSSSRCRASTTSRPTGGWHPRTPTRCVPRRHLPGAPVRSRRARCCTCCGAAASATRRPAVVPYLAHPWVVANDRMKDAGWTPSHSNEEAILLASPAPAPSSLPWIAAAGACVVALSARRALVAARRRSPCAERCFEVRQVHARHSSHSGVK